MTDTPGSTPDPGDLAQPAEPAAAMTGNAMTGNPALDEALRGLDDAAGAPPTEQIPVYEAAHHALQQTLATIDES
jgi:hypothetical protein